MPGLVSSARELSRLLDEVADVNWGHPAWWGLIGGTALLERVARPAAGDDGDLYASYLAANGGPRSDTFMARPHPPGHAAVSPVLLAIFRARAALAALARFEGAFPGQPLHQALVWRHGWLERAPVAPKVAFVTPRGVALAELPHEDDATRLAAALADFASGDPPRPPLAAADPRLPTAAPVAVAIGSVPRATARHIHRRAWTAHGGPWLGIGDTIDLELVTTCHLGVDGYGHGLLTTAILHAVDAACERLGHGFPVRDFALPAFSPFHAGEPLGIAHAVLPATDGTFPRAAYAIGRAVERVFRADQPPAARRAARHAPTFQVPLAPGARAHGDDDRRRRRVLFAILALTMRDGEFEPYADFRARLQDLLARESAGGGLLTRILTATTRAPLPRVARRILLASSGETSRLVPAIEVLGGRASLSSLRYPANERCAPPLLAVSSPAVRDSVVLTLVHHADTCTATVCGTGRAATDSGARAFLDAWRAELSEVP